jgi:hypothetical protein
MKVNLLIFFFSFLIILLVIEFGMLFFIRGGVGRLSIDYYDNGSYYFLPNQKGFYYNPEVKRINNLGYRGNDVFSDDLDGKKIISVLGDSYAFGSSVDLNETISEQLNDVLGRKEFLVLNLALPAHGVEDMLKRMKEAKKSHETDLFVFVAIEHDFYRPVIQRSFLEKIYIGLKTKSMLFSFVSYKAERLLINFGLLPEENIAVINDVPLAEKNIQKVMSLREEAIKQSAEIVFVFYEAERTRYSEEYELFCSQNNLNCITNVPEILSGLDENELFAADGIHHTGKAYGLLAEYLAQYFKEKQLI